MSTDARNKLFLNYSPDVVAAAESAISDVMVLYDQEFGYLQEKLRFPMKIDREEVKNAIMQDVLSQGIVYNKNKVRELAKLTVNNYLWRIAVRGEAPESYYPKNQKSS